MAFRRRMRRVSRRRLRVTDPFWTRWQEALRREGLSAQFDQLKQTDRLENFHRVARGENGSHVGIYFNDSDVYKWLEAVAYVLAAGDDARLREQADEAIRAIEAAQMADGYLNTYFQLQHPNLRWKNLYAMHEMYCAGHLFEAAVAWSDELEDRRLLDVSIKFADHIAGIFGPGKRLGFCGHEEIELALMKLAVAAERPDYHELAEWMVEMRGQSPHIFEAELSEPDALKLNDHGLHMLRKNGVYSGEYNQDHAPIREHTEVVGHAVRAMYLYMAAAEMAGGKADGPLEAALERTWRNLTTRRMYLTGGIGPSSRNEGFTEDFDLPNLTAYAETCAACGVVFWGHRLLEMTGNAEYAEITERALFNGALAGISLDSTKFFYVNPLESRGGVERVPWFHCACCPPNIARLIGSVSDYCIGTSENDLYVHIPIGCEMDLTLGGVPVKVSIESGYPWNGRFTVRVEPERPAKFRLHIRIPDWSTETETDLPGLSRPAEYERGYAVFDREWAAGETLTVDYGMEPRWVECDPRVRDNLGRVALQNGPLVYALEEADFGMAPQLLWADVDAPITSEPEPTLDVPSLVVEGMADVETFPEGLYAEAGTLESRPVSAKFIPYFAWANRGPGAMNVWTRRL